MEQAMQMRWLMAGLGAAAGATFWALIEAADRGALSDRLLLVLFVTAGAFFASGLMMAGPLPLRRALGQALGIGLLAGTLVWLVSQRYDGVEETFVTPFPALALLALVTIPVPFLIAGGGPGWRDYPALFEGSWSIVVRAVVAWLFTGAIWAVVLLSDLVLGIVGIGIVGQIAYKGFMPFVITGAGFGLALAVVDELRHLIDARLVVRLMRLLAPVVLLVSAVFILVAPVRGLSNLFDVWSAAGVLASMGIAALTLLTLVVDRDDAAAPESPVLSWSARGLALVLPVLAGLALWAVALRVRQYGWTPDRLFAGVAVAVLLAYGLWHALAVLRGAGWRARIRAGNLGIALVVVALAALWLTPLLNAERISASSFEARILAGETRDHADLWRLSTLGKAGAAARARLDAAAQAPGAEALSDWLKAAEAGDGQPAVLDQTDRAALMAEVVAALPLQPGSATGTRDTLLGLMQDHELRALAEACARRLPTGGPGCVMVVADLLPEVPGEEAVLGMVMDGWSMMDSLMIRDGGLYRSGMRTVDGGYLEHEDTLGLMADWQATPPPLAPVRLNQLGTGVSGVFMLP